MGGLLERMHTLLIAHQIAARHSHLLQTYPDILSQNSHHVPSRLEDTIVGTFSRRHANNTIYVHWGAYESGKSRAAKVAAARLQRNMGKPVMLLHGYDLYMLTSMREWLRKGIGIPPDRPDDTLSAFMPDDKQALVIVDHADTVLSKYGTRDAYEALRELGAPVLVIVSAWEHALDLKKRGAQLLGTPGFARWSKDELTQLYHSLLESGLCNREGYTDKFMECATLAGCPGILINDAFTEPNMLRSRLIDAEWRNGIRALNGEDVVEAGRFPDKAGKFHWQEEPAIVE
jgi:hypothetical protein